MQTGLTLPSLVTQIKDNAANKRDFLANTQKLTFRNGRVDFDVNDEVLSVQANRIATEQIAAAVGIPQRYFDRMAKEAPLLLDQNVNTWFKDQPKNRMVRTLRGNLRAFLSDRYRPLDNDDVAANVLPRIIEAGFEVRSAQITESRMYIQAATPKITGEVKKGDVVQSGIVISNSEVGLGRILIEPMVYRLVCLNGMIAGAALRKSHVGRSLVDGDNSFELFSDETKKLTDKAFWAQVNEVVSQTVKPELFQKLLSDMQTASGEKIDKPQEAVEIVAEKFNLADEEKLSVLDNLIKGSDASKWGLVNAVTAVAHTTGSYDRSVELERIGGQVLELSQNDLIKN